MEIIDDLIVLGMAVPERTADGRRTVCMGGYSPARGFIRIYPCRPDINVKRWDILRLEVERNRLDPRPESWQIINASTEWELLNRRIEVAGRIQSPLDRRALLERQLSPCVATINDRRGSMGVILVQKIHRTYFANNPQYQKPYQPHLIGRPGEWARPKSSFSLEPRLAYSCSGCKSQHDQKVLEWGAFEWMRKNPRNVEQYWENARMYSAEHDLFLLVGNQRLQRTSFLVINIIPIQREKQQMNGARYAKQLTLF